MAYATIKPNDNHTTYVNDGVFAAMGAFRQLKKRVERNEKINRKNNWKQGGKKK